MPSASRIKESDPVRQPEADVPAGEAYVALSTNVDFIGMAPDFVRLYRQRKKGNCGPHQPEREIEIPGLRKTSCYTRQHVALLALTHPALFAACIGRIDDDYSRANASFLAHLNDVIADPTRLRTLAVYWHWRGITDDVASRMVKRKMARRRVALPVFVPAYDDVQKAAKYLMRLHDIVRRDASDAVNRAAADEARVKSRQEERHAMAERHRMEVEHAEMVACGDDELLTGIE